MTNRKGPERPEKQCETPDELLKSEGFARFLGFFNKSRHRFEVLKEVIPSEVASDPVLADKVYLFYLESGKSVPVEGVRKEAVGHLARQTIIHIRRSAAQALRPAEGGWSEIPEWLKLLCAEEEPQIPAEAVQQMERSYQQWFPLAVETYPKARFSKGLVSLVMNNFLVNVVRRRNSLMGASRPLDERILGKSDPGYGKRIREMTWGEFFGEVDAVVEEKGINISELEGMDQVDINMVLLPVLLELLRRGYKVYPDLTI